MFHIAKNRSQVLDVLRPDINFSWESEFKTWDFNYKDYPVRVHSTLFSREYIEYVLDYLSTLKGFYGRNVLVTKNKIIITDPGECVFMATLEPNSLNGTLLYDNNEGFDGCCETIELEHKISMPPKDGGFKTTEKYISLRRTIKQVIFFLAAGYVWSLVYA